MTMGFTRHISLSEEELLKARSVSFIKFTRQISITTEDGEVQSVSDRINAMGFGTYQVHVFILCAGFIVAEGACLQMASGMSAAVAAQFGITSTFRQSLLMMYMFIGLASGTIASGPFGDIYGRRLPMLIGYVGIIATCVLAFLIPGLVALYVLFFTLGCFAGFGIPTALITLSEATPDANRGVSTGALGIAFCLGELWAAVGLRVILPDLLHGPWRFLVLWAAIPALCLLIFGFLSPVTKYDTAHFLGVRGRNGELVEAINLIAAMNGRPESSLEAGAELNVESSEALSFKDAMQYLLAWPMAMFTMVQSIMFFAKDLGFYGMGVFWPLAWRESSFGMEGSLELIVTAAIGIPGVGVAVLVMGLLPRRVALSVGALCCAVAAFVIQGLIHGRSYGFVGVILFKLFYPTWQMVTMLLPSEVFPTQVRVWAWSLVGFFGRIAAIIAPMLVNTSKATFLRSCGALALAVAIIVWTLPETKDCELKCLDKTTVDNEIKFFGGGGGKEYGSFDRSHSW
mmetsp:Transcript_105378/g.298287  ORF Transcript_105378/g.298287 Transcript_105378/m.298287 type:complete len:514 (+) Transcript_105378:73-1614(+)